MPDHTHTHTKYDNPQQAEFLIILLLACYSLQAGSAEKTAFLSVTLPLC